MQCGPLGFFRVWEDQQHLGTFQAPQNPVSKQAGWLGTGTRISASGSLPTCHQLLMKHKSTTCIQPGTGTETQPACRDLCPAAIYWDNTTLSLPSLPCKRGLAQFLVGGWAPVRQTVHNEAALSSSIKRYCAPLVSGVSWTLNKLSCPSLT